MTMATMKTLMLAAFAALTLGAGTAMAQDGGGGGMDYWSQQNMKAIQQGAMQANRTAGCDNELWPTCADEFWPTFRC
jgi:hypothetical protein